MRRSSTIRFALLLGIPVGAALAVAAVQSQTPTPGLSVPPGFTVPSGFAVERVAGPPLVNRPIVADFDEQGRLYVADSSGSNDPVKKQLTDKPHRIVRLEDTDGDGRFDKSVVFADKMMFPEGTMWLDGSLYVAAPPSIWKLTDTNGDGVADTREEWFEGKTLTNCANDLHGPYFGPDGWIYWAKGAFAEQSYERAGKAPFVTRASHIFRRRPGSAAIEPVMTGGMDNPVDVAFTPGGERIFTATFLEHPQVGRRDALIHAIYGGVYGKPHAVLDGHKRTGDLMPGLSELGPAAPAGLTRYSSRVFGEEYRDNFFAALFNMQKVTRHVLEPRGATFTSRDSDFLVSSSRDFHPTDVIEDADGSLLVVDTGAWYKLCCPTSQLAAPEVLGAIYRVRRTGAATPADPRGLKLAWGSMPPADLVKLLDAGLPAVEARALNEFGRRGSAAIAALASAVKSSASSPHLRLNAVWALTRIDAPPARVAVRQAVSDSDASARQAAIHSASVWRDAGALPALVSALKSGPPSVQRAAAEAIGRIGDASAVPDLLSAAAAPLDRVLEHSLTYALIEIASPAATTAGLHATSPTTRRAALVALDQMDGGGLKPDAVLSLLDSGDPVLKDTSWWIAGNHAEWGGAVADYLRTRLGAAGQREELQQRLVQFGESPAIQALLPSILERAAGRDERLVALRAMARTRAKELPPIWIAPLTSLLTSGDVDVARAAVTVARAAPVSGGGAADLQSALLRVAREGTRPIDLRVDALAAIRMTTPLPADLFDLLRESLQPTKPVSLRMAAAGVVEKARLDREQLTALTAVIEAAGPLELPRLLAPFDGVTDEAIGLRLIAALRQSKGRASIRPDILRPRLEKSPPAVQREADALLAALNVETARQARRLDELLASLAGGDIRRGQAVFNSPTAACMTCHAIGYMGGRVGPDLTRIGQVRSERDLLEAIVFPSASFARSYEPVVVTTTAGETHGGLLRSDQADEIVLATGAGQEIRIPRNQVEDVQPGTVSVMPPGLDQQLTRQELADLLAFLKATRSGA
jgi:putative membrane-bound dehydrogenase-like protein